MSSFAGAIASESAGRWPPLHRALWRAWRRRRPPPRLDSVRSILVVRFDELGDLVLTSAFLRELRRNALRARITLAVRPHGEEFARLCPHVDNVIVAPLSGSTWTAAAAARLRMATWRENLPWLFRRPHELILLPRRGPEFGGADFFAYTRGMGYVAGLRDEATPSLKDARYREGFYERRFPVAELVHEADYPLRLLSSLGGTVESGALEAWSGAEDRAWADRFVREHLDAHRPWAVVHPSGGRSVLKQWPIEHFREVMDSLSQSEGLQWVVVGGKDEAWMAEAFPALGAPRVVNQVGELPWGRLTALLQNTALFLGGDSGPAHLAAAAGAPAEVLFGPTSRARFAPRGPRVRVLSLDYPCSPDRTGTFQDRCARCIYDRPLCLHALTPAAVIAACRERLASRAA